MDLEKATKGFSSECLVGSGAFGNVYKGLLEGEDHPIAIKRPHAVSQQSEKEFRNGKAG